MVPSLHERFVRLLLRQQGMVGEHKQKKTRRPRDRILRLLPARLRLRSNLHPPIEKISFLLHLFGNGEDIQSGHIETRSPLHS